MNSFRYLILFLSTCTVTFIYSNRIVFGFTVICQQPDNSTSRPDYYLSDPVNKAWMFTFTAIGMCFGPLPLTYAYKYGTAYTTLVYGVISSLSSLLYPMADIIGFYPSLATRFFAGFAQASQLHISNDIVLNWAAKEEGALFFSILLSASQIGPLITMSMGGELCTSRLGWQSTYYILGFLTLVSSILFCFFYSEEPSSNIFVSDEEKQYIIQNKAAKPEKSPVPKLAVITDPTILVSLIMFGGYYLGMIIYQQYSPTFIKQVLQYNIRETGYFSAIPMIFGIIIKIACGKLIDHGMGLNAKWRLAIPLIILEVPSAISIFLTGFMDDRRMALFFDMLFACLHFFVPVICSKTIQVVGAQHAHFALNVNMVLAGVIQIFIPACVQLVVPDNTKEQWAYVFYFLCVLILVTTLLYSLITKAEPAKWTMKKNQSDDVEKHNDVKFY